MMTYTTVTLHGHRREVDHVSLAELLKWVRLVHRAQGDPQGRPRIHIFNDGKEVAILDEKASAAFIRQLKEVSLGTLADRLTASGW